MAVPTACVRANFHRGFGVPCGRVTRWDLRSAAATFALGVVFFVVAWVITAATDEGAVSWTVRILRTLPALPACGAAATLVVLRRAETRGELLALATLGARPARSASFVVAAAAGLSFAGAAAVLAYAPAADAFFPRPPSASAVRVDASGPSVSFADDERGLRITQDGTMSRVPEEARAFATASRRRSERIAAAMLLLALGLALALATARKLALPVVLWGALGVASCVFLLQASAAGKLPPLVACIPAAALLAFAAVRYRSPAW